METNKNQVVALQPSSGAPGGRSYKDGTALGRFNNALFSPTMQMYISDVLRGRSSQFVNNVANIVSSNGDLMACEPSSVIFAALKAAELGFTVNNTMGHAFVIAFNKSGSAQKQAQLQIGYKGFVQLALRSGAYKTINVCDVKAGELVKIDYQKDEFHFDWKLPDERAKLDVVGYTAYFEMQNGFVKQTYWSIEQVRAHAMKYSVTYKDPRGLWTKQFDPMAKKTVLKMLLSKWGLLSADLQVAVTFDQAAVSDGQPVYIDKQPEQSADKVAAVAAFAGAVAGTTEEGGVNAVSTENHATKSAQITKNLSENSHGLAHEPQPFAVAKDDKSVEKEPDDDWEPTNAELDRLFAGEQNVMESGLLD